LQALVNSETKSTIDELIDYNQKSRKVSKLFSNVFTGEGSGGHSNHHESILKDKLARKKKKKLREQEKAAKKNTDENYQEKTQQTVAPVPTPAPLVPIAEISDDAESLAHIPPEEDVYAMKADPRKCIIKETADILNSIGTAPKVEAVVVEVESIISSSDSDDDSMLSSDDPSADVRRSVWDYATALDEEDVTSHRCVVCVPDTLMMSEVRSLPVRTRINVL
jgi:hypothetical protein